MTMETQELTMPIAGIELTIKMIKMLDNQIENDLKAGLRADSLAIRQAKHQRNKFLRELDALLLENGINLHELTV